LLFAQNQCGTPMPGGGRPPHHPEVLQRPKSPDGVFTFDLKQQGREQEK
jgi:hypothetical protein